MSGVHDCPCCGQHIYGDNLYCDGCVPDQDGCDPELSWHDDLYESATTKES